MKLAVWSYQSPGHLGVSRAASSFANVHTILRAPKGDGYGTIMLAMFERLGVPPPLTVSAMTEATLAGSAADIGRTIADVDARCKPDAIVVTRSATASVLQEPLDGEIAMIPAGTIHADIIQASAHPLRDTEASAFARTVCEIVDRYALDGVPRTARPSVNIVGPSLLGFHDHSNVESLRRLFADIGVEVRSVIPLGASPADLQAAGSAWLNVCTAYELAQSTLELLHERFETPFIAVPPYGEAGTARFLRAVAEVLELPATRLAHAARNAKLGWYARTVDAHALSAKRVAVFGAPSAAAGIARALREELDMRVEFVGTYVTAYGDWLAREVADITDRVLVTDDFNDVAQAIDEIRPDIMFGSQMERHSASRFGVPCAVISPPAHVLNFPLGYAPLLGYDGANHLGDIVNQTQVLGLEHHLIETFGPRGQGRFAEAAPEGVDEYSYSTHAHGGSSANGSRSGNGSGNGSGLASGARVNGAGGHPNEAAAQTVDGSPRDASAVDGANSGLQWDDAAERLMRRVPFFVRKKARGNVERYARENGIALVEESTILAAREHFGG